MSTRDERLSQFFGGYFNQDWDAGGATSWHDVVVDYVQQVPRSHAVLLVDDLRSWAADATQRGLSNLPRNFECDYDPRVDGMTDRQWVEQMADAIEKQLSN
jgi:hypothetical protein